MKHTALALALLARVAAAQDSTITITMPRILEAANQGFGFTMVERQFGSRCFTISGQNNGKGEWGQSRSEALNAYASSVCRHTGFGTRNLQNGWRVASVGTSTACRFNDWGTWRTLTASQCTFTIRTTPTVGSASPFFEADVTVRGSGGQDRHATLTWAISIRGPRGKSPWVLQSPTAPTVTSPANDAQVAGAASLGWSHPSTGPAAFYKVCISREGTVGCEERTRVTTNSAPNVTVPFRGERVRWFVQACNTAGCTSSTSSRTLRNTLPAATLVSPAHNSTAANRRPTFQWQTVPGAQTYTLYVYHANPLQEFSLPNLSSNVTQFTPATDLTLSNPMYWYVRACNTATGCGWAVNSQQLRALNLPPPPTFVGTLAATFRHDRCRNCHAVTATNFAVPSTPGLPSGHSAVSSATNCQSCHTNTLLPTTGTVNPGWHSPPASMDFRNKTDVQLCDQAKTLGTAAAISNHLKEDKLVLWAVGDGRRPGNATPLALAPPGSITSWRTLVDNWINGNMVCQ